MKTKFLTVVVLLMGVLFLLAPSTSRAQQLTKDGNDLMTLSDKETELRKQGDVSQKLNQQQQKDWGCEVQIQAPDQYGSQLTATGYVKCKSALFLPYLRMCIYKHKKFRPDQEIACTSVSKLGDTMGGYLQPWDKRVTGQCKGKGTYYTRIRWFEGSVKTVLFAINPPASLKEFRKGIKGIADLQELKSDRFEYCY